MEARTQACAHRERIVTPEQIYRRMASRLVAEKREHFFALALDAKGRLIDEFLIAIGTLTSVQVTAREAFRPLVIAAAAQAIFVHNHPSGDPSPSKEDSELTTCLSRAGELLGIRVVDHVVVAQEGFASLAASLLPRAHR